MSAGVKYVLMAWLGTFFLFVCVAHGNFETTDAGFTMHAARALWHRGDSALLTRQESEGQEGVLIGVLEGAAFIKQSERLQAEGKGMRSCGMTGVDGLVYVWFPMGHVFLLSPVVPLGDAVGRWLPDADDRFRQRVAPVFAQSFVEGSPVATQAVMSLLAPTMCIATSLLLLYRIARELGADARAAVFTALSICVATQVFSLGREQLSDGPGLTLLLAAMLPVVRLHCGRGTAAAALWAGAMSGCAVLVRYQTALTVVLFALIVAAAARRRCSWRLLAAFLLGGLPLLMVFVSTNYFRYGDPLETGYPSIGDWFRADFFVGFSKMLFAAGRGVMWFSPLLWLALPAATSQRSPMRLRWLAWALFLTPVALFSTAQGWQGGQAWAIRYVTPGVVALCALVLPQARPWDHRPRAFKAMLVVGCFVSLTSIVAPVRGQIELMSHALRAHEQRAVAAGTLEAHQQTVDTADVGGWHPRYSPLYRNWLYAWHSRVGGFEGADGAPSAASDQTVGAVYGVAARTPEQATAPLHWADRCGRHLWWRFWGDLYGVSGLLLVVPFAVLGSLLAWFGWRGLSRKQAAGLSGDAGSTGSASSSDSSEG